MNKKIDIAVRAAEIAKEKEAVVLGIGHFVLACNEVKEFLISECEIEKECIKNGYMDEYVRFVYSKENTSPNNSGMTPFARKVMPILSNLLEDIGDYEKYISSAIETICNTNEFPQFIDNFYLWIDENAFDITTKFNGIKYRIEDKFAEFNFITNLNSRVEIQNPKIIGRDKELYELTSILLKKTKSNALLVGDAGVGKTAIVEKLAQQINSGEIYESLKDSVILELNVSALVSGTRYRGDFEERFNKFLKKLDGEDNVILFIDEFHTIMDAGGSEGALNASNILKPALARGGIKVIGATTYDEYRKFVEQDKAFSRRFEKVDIEESSEEETKIILDGLKSSYENYHNVIIDDKVIDKILELCNKYIANKHFPDKAIDVLDTACVETKMLNQEHVNINTIISTVEKKTNVKILKTELLNGYNDIFKETIKGQDNAINEVSETLKLIDLGLVDSSKPMATLLFTGPTGVGKTEMAKQIAKTYFGSERKLIRLDMGEYSSEADTSKLFGAAPGYVGYDNSSVLIEGVKKQPYSVVLFDEIEKTHPKIMNALLQLLDEGFITSSTGDRIDFRHTIVIMTSNVGFHNTDTTPISFVNSENSINKKRIDESIKDTFSPEFLNRIEKIIYFDKLTKDNIKEIAESYMKEFGNFTLTNDELEEILTEADVEKQGARAVQRIVRTKVLPSKLIANKKASTVI